MLSVAIKQALHCRVQYHSTMTHEMHLTSVCMLADNELLAARVAGQALSKADVNRMVAER
jgi:hypothetical protein